MYEAGKINLLSDRSRGAYVHYAKKQDVIVFQGPFGLKQGGKGIAVRNPVYIARNGKKNSGDLRLQEIHVN